MKQTQIFSYNQNQFRSKKVKGNMTTSSLENILEEFKKQVSRLTNSTVSHLKSAINEERSEDKNKKIKRTQNRSLNSEGTLKNTSSLKNPSFQESEITKQISSQPFIQLHHEEDRQIMTYRRRTIRNRHKQKKTEKKVYDVGSKDEPSHNQISCEIPLKTEGEAFLDPNPVDPKPLNELASDSIYRLTQRSIGLITHEYEEGKGTGFGTGFIIDKKYVVTVCHNLIQNFDQVSVSSLHDQIQNIHRKINSKIKFWQQPSPTLEDLNKQKICHEIEKIIFPSTLLANHSDLERQDYDFAIIKLKNQVYFQKQQQLINSNSLEAEQYQQVGIFGYSAQKQKKSEKIPFQKLTRLGDCGEISTLKKNKIKFEYKINTFKGTSGSPLLQKIDNKIQVIGMHQSSNQNSNFGFKMSGDLLQFITETIESDKAQHEFDDLIWKSAKIYEKVKSTRSTLETQISDTISQLSKSMIDMLTDITSDIGSFNQMFVKSKINKKKLKMPNKLSIDKGMSEE